MNWKVWNLSDLLQATHYLIVGAILLNFLFNYLDDGMELTLNESAGDAGQGKVVNTLASWTAIQVYLDRPKRWANRNLRKLSRGKVLLLERNYSVHQYKLRLSAWKAACKKRPKGSWPANWTWTSNTSLWQRKITFSCDCSQTVEQVAQRGCGILHMEEILRALIEQNPEEPDQTLKLDLTWKLALLWWDGREAKPEDLPGFHLIILWL